MNKFRDLMAENESSANVFICGVPFDKNASVGKGASEAPRVLRELSYDLPALDMMGNSLKKIKISDLGDFSGEDFDKLKDDIENKLLSKDGFHVILGGDHSIAIASERAFYDRCIKNGKTPVIIHMDAHPDICDVYEGSKYSHACPIFRALEYGYKYFVRTRLENRRRKGFALEEAYNHLKENNIDFDSLIIFDADNILTPSYISKLNDLKAMGYEIGVGVRESTNADTNYISASSALLFNFQSRFVNKARSYLFDKVVISGTGYFIDKKIVEDAGGWIWTGLTEDVDLTRYAYINGIKMGYNSTAIYFDEQPTDLKTLHNQHVRWIWGYMNKGIIELAISKNPKYRKTNKMGRREFFI